MSESQSDGAVQTIKCMILGDSFTGKTHLFKKFTGQSFPVDYVPTVFDISDVMHVNSTNGSTLNLNLWDSAGSHVYDNVRPISYPHTHCFILCYNVNDSISFENLTNRWLPEIKKHGDGPSVPIILAGTLWEPEEHHHLNESDNKESGVNGSINESQLERIQEEIGAKASFVCSININQSIIQNAHNVLQTAIDFACEKKEEDEKPNDPIWKFCSPTIVIMGDRGVGKSSLVEAWIKNEPIQNLQTKSEKPCEYYHDLVRNGCEYFLKFVEICSEMELKNYLAEQIDVLVLCYAINDPFSFQTVQTFQNHHGTFKFPVILIGTKCDLRGSSCIIPTIDGKLLSQKLSCATFTEFSAKTLENSSTLFGAILENIGSVH